MTKTLHPGDKVAWNTSQGETHGKVVRKMTKAGHIKGHAIAASTDNPEYVVRSDKSGDEAAHKPASLKRR